MRSLNINPVFKCSATARKDIIFFDSECAKIEKNKKAQLAKQEFLLQPSPFTTAQLAALLKF